MSNEVKQIFNEQLNASIADLLIKEMTAERVIVLVRKALSEKSGYYQRPFVESVLDDLVKEAARTAIKERISDSRDLIKQKVEEVLKQSVIEKLVSSLNFDVTINYEK